MKNGNSNETAENIPSGTIISETISKRRFPLELPEGMSREAVTWRMNAMIDAGTDAHIAAEMALTAETQQMERDALNA